MALRSAVHPDDAGKGRFSLLPTVVLPCQHQFVIEGAP